MARHGFDNADPNGNLSAFLTTIYRRRACNGASKGPHTAPLLSHTSQYGSSMASMSINAEHRCAFRGFNHFKGASETRGRAG